MSRKNCLNCGKPLTGKQTKNCSASCKVARSQRKANPAFENVYVSFDDEAFEFLGSSLKKAYKDAKKNKFELNNLKLLSVKLSTLLHFTK